MEEAAADDSNEETNIISEISLTSAMEPEVQKLCENINTSEVSQDGGADVLEKTEICKVVKNKGENLGTEICNLVESENLGTSERQTNKKNFKRELKNNSVDKETYVKEIDTLKREKFCLESEVMKMKQNFADVKAQHVMEMGKLKSELLGLKNEKACFAADIGRFQQDMGDWFLSMRESTEASIRSLDASFQRDSQEKRELLSEMTSMNEELNRRGETISSLKEVVSMYEKKVIDLNSQQDCSLSTIKQLRDELRDRTQRLHDLSNQQDTNSNIICQLRDELSNTSQRLQDQDSQQNVSNNQIKQLRDELAETNQRLSHSAATCRDLEQELARLRDNHAAASEADRLSTSTVSRVEDISRLRDVEDSFEDRYCKLKVVAAKLKKRATETQQLLDSERQKWTNERSEFVNKLNQFNASVRNNQTLQHELDRLGDELEEERKECKMLRKAATDAKGAEVNLKVKLEEATTNIEILKNNLDTAIKERDSVTQALHSKESELVTALKEKVAEELIRKEKAKEVAVLEERLREEQERQAVMQKAVDSAKVEARKQSVLSLEMQSYEKSLSDMNSQLKMEKSRVGNLEAEVETLQDIRDSLQEQIRLLEERVAAEEGRCQHSHDQLVATRASLQAADSRVFELEGRVAQLTERLESERAGAEAATLELASLSSAVQTNTDIMLRDKQELLQQVSSLSAQVTSLTNSLEHSQDELATVQADFDKYKVRAQSVLRKHQTSGATQAEADAKQQVDQLKQLTEALQDKLDQSAIQMEQLQSELRVVSNERELAETRCVNLNIALADKTQQLERTLAEHRSQKLSLDTLVNCYKSQLEEKDKAAEEQLLRFTEEIDALRGQLRDRSDTQQTLTAETAATTTTVAPVQAEPPLLEREDGEGSEYIPDYSPRHTPPLSTPKPLLPLDKLLETNDNLHGEREQLEAELNVVKAELERSRKRAQHQAALLAESEQDAARKEQLATVLKQEIGRLERCIQRQPHAQNTEYLKNIVFKFVTLETGEDRMRLVPVITTLLQLSPEETQRLTVIAKGESPDAAGSWGSYFGGWR